MKSVRIHTSDLAKAVKVLKLSAGTAKASIPICRQVYGYANPESFTVQLTTTDLDTWTTVELDTITLDFEAYHFNCNVHDLEKVLKRAKGNDVLIQAQELDKEGEPAHGLIVHTTPQQQQYTLNTCFDMDDRPLGPYMPTYPGNRILDTWTNTAKFVEAANRVKTSALDPRDDETRALHGIAIFSAPQEVRLVASNRHTMYIAAITAHNALTDDKEKHAAPIPIQAYKILEAGNKAGFCIETVDIKTAMTGEHQDKLTAELHSGKVLIISRCAGIDHVDVDSFLRYNGKHSVRVANDDLAAAVDAMEPSHTKDHKRMHLFIGDTTISAKMHNPISKIDSAYKTAAPRYNTQALDQAFNQGHMHTFTKTLPGRGLANVFFDPNNNECTIYRFEENGTGYTFLINPLLTD